MPELEKLGLPEYFEKTKEGYLSCRVDLQLLKETVRTVIQKSMSRFIGIVALDYGLDIELLYNFSLNKNILTIKTMVPKEENKVESIVAIVPAAEWSEREICDLFGIKFLGHPNLESLILPAGWPQKEHPLRQPIRGSIPPHACSILEALFAFGTTIRPSSWIKQKREEAGLPGIPPLIYGDERALAEVQKLLRDIEFDRRAGYDWLQKRLRGGR